MGFTAEHFPAPEVEVWEESWDAFSIFLELQNQWRCSSGGAIGLDYSVVFSLLDRRRVEGEAFDEIMCRLRIIEAEALNQINKGGK